MSDNTPNTGSFSSANLEFFLNYLEKNTGISVDENQMYLIQNRLSRVLELNKIASLDELIGLIKTNSNSQLQNQVIESMATYETSFFRDKRPFDYLQSVFVQKMIDEKKDRRIRIWSSACSSGQEPYTIAICMMEALKKLDPEHYSLWRVEIVASDLSSHILNKAQEGLFTQFEIQRGLPATYLIKYFKQESEGWRIIDEIRRMVSFRIHNLLNDPISLGKFDMIFCRNVLIYFQKETKTLVLKNIEKAMVPGGILAIGSSEVLFSITHCFSPIKDYNGIYSHIE